MPLVSKVRPGKEDKYMKFQLKIGSQFEFNTSIDQKVVVLVIGILMLL